ncbi:four-carbon acid sugar kinase family protein [Azorhizobium doebereinerae]|uniref:four-carbon acid sugar kinase family protein n=1 Tax=Azorhizobium doebereinerae TaxID=281091 RepID=UPI00041A2089|nr:four-carbon acid sugar kinase family protein [Azorhizobium doebereinerae]
MTPAPRYGWYGDDFTGASDTLAVLAQRGQRALLFRGLPTPEQLRRAGPLDAVGIAGASRAMGLADMTAELGLVAAFFAGLGVRVLHYKCCSTFDSAPQVGSIGHAVSVLAPSFPNPFRPIVGGQPNIGRYCTFSNLFAAAGTGGEVHRIDRHPTMSVHPVTPMGEGDLRRHLAAQGLGTVAALHYPAYADEAAALDARLAALLTAHPDAVLCDIAGADDLAVVGRLIWGAAERATLLAVGASSVAQAVCAHWGAEPVPPAPLAPAQGPVFLLAGSLSPVTRRQMQAAVSYAPVPLDAARLARDPAYAADGAQTIAGLLRAGRSVLATTAPEGGEGEAALGPAEVAAATAAFLTAVLARAPVRRLGIAGGDTSSRAVQALDLWGLSYLGAPSPGVALCRVHSDAPALDGLELMLKGGQMGSPDLFERLLHGG